MTTNLFDKVTFEKDDIVISKNKDKDSKPHVVREVKIVTNSNEFSYLVLFFNDDDTFHVAYEYEPYDKEERKQYYEIWNRHSIKPKKKVKSVKPTNVKSRTKVQTFNINNIKND